MKGSDSRREEVKDNCLGLCNRVVIITSLKLIKACRADAHESFHFDGVFYSSAETFSQSALLKAGIVFAHSKVSRLAAVCVRSK